MVGDNPDPSVVAQVAIFRDRALVNLFPLLSQERAGQNEVWALSSLLASFWATDLRCHRSRVLRPSDYPFPTRDRGRPPRAFSRHSVCPLLPPQLLSAGRGATVQAAEAVPMVAISCGPFPKSVRRARHVLARRTAIRATARNLLCVLRFERVEAPRQSFCPPCLCERASGGSCSMSPCGSTTSRAFRPWK